MNTVRLYIALGLLVALVLGWAGSCLYVHHQGYAAGEAAGNAKVMALQTQYAAATAKAEADARTKEQASAAHMAQIWAYHQQEMEDAQAKSDRVAADLRAGNLRLREQWRGCAASANVSATVAGAGKPDAAANLRAEDPQRTLRDSGAGQLVKYGAEADATIAALQAVIRADRGEP